LPTTVLAQADSGVGVKNGINLFGKKNFVGTFAPPWAVVVDSAFLETLSRRDVLSGLAEAAKVALVRDRVMFDWMKTHARGLADDADALEDVIRKSAEAHLAHICDGGDPFEAMTARPLDFGHWSAHKLEAMSGHRLRHGEAVAIGIALDTLYSARAGLLDRADAQRAIALLENLGLTLWDDTLDRRDGRGRPLVLTGIQEFREHLGGALTITLLAGIGKGIDVHFIDDEMMIGAIEMLRKRAAV
jgi:3-dehydroquinate synthase